MKDGMYVDTMRERFQHAFYYQERLADFLEWLFDTELDYTTQSEMWAKFEAWEDQQQAITPTTK